MYIYIYIYIWLGPIRFGSPEERNSPQPPPALDPLEVKLTYVKIKVKVLDLWKLNPPKCWLKCSYTSTNTHNITRTCRRRRFQHGTHWT